MANEFQSSTTYKYDPSGGQAIQDFQFNGLERELFGQEGVANSGLQVTLPGTVLGSSSNPLNDFQQMQMKNLTNNTSLKNMGTLGLTQSQVSGLTDAQAAQAFNATYGANVEAGGIPLDVLKDVNAAGLADGTPAPQSFLGKAFGGVKSFFSPKINEEAGVATDAPFVGIATGLGALGQIYLGNKQLDQAEDVFNFNRKLAIANFTQQQNAAVTNIFNKARNEAILAGKSSAEANTIGDQAVSKSGIQNTKIG